jgi:hypothetical protein
MSGHNDQIMNSPWARRDEGLTFCIPKGLRFLRPIRSSIRCRPHEFGELPPLLALMPDEAAEEPCSGAASSGSSWLVWRLLTPPCCLSSQTGRVGRAVIWQHSETRVGRVESHARRLGGAE